MSSEPNSPVSDEQRVREIEDLAYAIRRQCLHMTHSANASHIGGCLSATDILATLYGDILRFDPEKPAWAERDRFVLSKGHCCAALYAALALKGFFPVEELEHYGQLGSELMCHASHKVPGVEWSTGSLGHGLGLACGQALAAQKRKSTWRVYALLSDGELDEGSTWEAVLFGAQHNLSALTAIVDRNGQQALGDTEGILGLEDLQAKFTAFGWDAEVVDGHDVSLLHSRLCEKQAQKPRVLIARTIKGRGVNYMENQLEWHYRAPKTQELLSQALQELAASYGREVE